jgi:hypothetical protein
MALSEERSAKNEARFRASNEHIERRRIDLIGDADDRATPFLCECDDLNCTAVVLLTLHEYEAARDSRRRFLICPGHVAENAEVVDRRDRFWLVEKQGEAGRVAESEAEERRARHDAA